MGGGGGGVESSDMTYASRVGGWVALRWKTGWKTKYRVNKSSRYLLQSYYASTANDCSPSRENCLRISTCEWF